MDELLQMFGIQFLQRQEVLFRNVFMEDDRYFFFFSWTPIKSIQMERRWIIVHVCK